MQLKYELYKISSKKLFFILLAIVLVLNTVLFFSDQQDQSYIYETIAPQYEEIAAQYQNMSPEKALEELEKINERLQVYMQIDALDIYDDADMRAEQQQYLKTEFADYYADYYAKPEEREQLTNAVMVYQQLLSEAQYIASYPSYIKGIAKQAEDMQKVSIFRKEGTFSYNNILKTPEDFEGLETLSLKFGRSDGLLAAVTFRITDALVLVMAFFVCFLIFLQEKESGTLNLLRSAKNGRARLAAAKLAAVSITIGVIAAVMYASVLTSSYVLYGGFGDLSRYVQSMSAFSRCTLPISVGGYVLLYFVSKIVAILLATFLFAVVFSLCSGSGQAYFVTGCLLIVNLGAYTLIPSLSYFNIFKYLSLFELTDTHSLYAKYNNINLFSIPVNRMAFSYGFAILVAVLAVAGTVWSFVAAKQFGGGRLARLADRIARFISRFGGSVKLFLHENFKLYISGKALLILIAAVVLTMNGLRQRDLFLYTPEEIYMNYVNQLLGEVTDEKIAFIEKEREDIDSCDEKIAQLSEQYYNGEISYAQFSSESMILTNSREARSEPFELVEKQLHYLQELKETRGIDGVFTNLRYTNEFFGNKRDGQILSALVMFLLIMAVSYLFTSEYQKGMIRIVTAAKYGKTRLFLAKYGAAALYSVLLWGVVFCRELIDMARFYPIGDLSAPIQSIERFSAIPVPISIFTYLCLLYGLRLLGTLAACAVTLALSILLKRRAFAVLLGASACILPMILQMLNLQDFSYVTLNGMFMLNELAAQQGGFIAVFLYTAVFCVLLAVLTVLVKRIFCNQKRRPRKI